MKASNKFTAILISLIISIASFADAPKISDTILVNGKNVHYEVYGEGPPLLLLHAYGMSSISWLPYVADYSRDYTVYLIDLTGHGKSDPFTETLSVKAVAADLNILISHLGITNTKAIGFSYGGDVLFQLALLNPSLIDKMVTIGAVGSWNIDDYPLWASLFTYANIDQYEGIRDLHSSEAQIKAIFEQFQNYRTFISNDGLKSITAHVLMVAGDDDAGTPLRELMRARKYLPSSDLWILPNVAHSAHTGENKQDFIRISKKFLEQNN